MLFLHFRIGEHNMALSTDLIVEVMPLSDLKPMRRAPDGIAGSYDYRGHIVPVVDLTLVETGRPSRRSMSTRIVVVRYPAQHEQLIGLMAEGATETWRINPDRFAPFAPGPCGLVQRVRVEELVPQALLTCLREQAGVAS